MSAFTSTRGQTTTGKKMASFSGRVLRLARQRAVLTLPRRRLSYPREPLNQPIPGLSAPTASSSLRPDQVDKASLAKVRVTELENGLRVASQEAFGQYSTIGGTCKRIITVVYRDAHQWCAVIRSRIIYSLYSIGGCWFEVRGGLYQWRVSLHPKTGLPGK